MGIENIDMLITPDLEYNQVRQQELQARAVEQKLVDDHRAGKHPWGKMIRACPLCPDH